MKRMTIAAVVAIVGLLALAMFASITSPGTNPAPTEKYGLQVVRVAQEGEWALDAVLNYSGNGNWTVNTLYFSVVSNASKTYQPIGGVIKNTTLGDNAETGGTLYFDLPENEHPTKLVYSGGGVTITTAELPVATYESLICSYTWKSGSCTFPEVNIHIDSVTLQGSQTPQIVGMFSITITNRGNNSVLCTPSRCSIFISGVKSGNDTVVNGLVASNGSNWTAFMVGPAAAGITSASSFSLAPRMSMTVSFNSLYLGSNGSGAPRTGESVTVTVSVPTISSGTAVLVS